MSLITPDFGLLVWMTLIFAIVFFVLAKWGFPMITGMVRERQQKISESLSQAEEARKLVGELEQSRKALVEESRRQQVEIVREANRLRDEIIEKAKLDATAEAAKLMEEAQARLKVEKENVLRDIRRDVALLSIDVAEKIVRRDLSRDENQLALIDKMVGEMEDKMS